MHNFGIKGSPSKERLLFETSIRGASDAGSIVKRGSLPQTSNNFLLKGKHPMRSKSKSKSSTIDGSIEAQEKPQL